MRCSLTGIGGQGVQLAAQVLARAAAVEGRQVMLFGVYSGMMRGGNSDSTIVVADTDIQAPPLISHAWSAIVMHHKFWEPMVAKLRPGAVVLVNSSLFEGDVDREAHQVIDVPVTDIAADLGNSMGASMVMVGRVRGDHRPGHARRRARGHARVDPALSPSAHREQRAGHPCRVGLDRQAGRARLGGGARMKVLTRGTVTIDIGTCKGCELCIAACPPEVLVMSDPAEVNPLGFRYPLLKAGLHGLPGLPAGLPRLLLRGLQVRDADRAARRG